ncbi:MAG: FAD-linked oxidase C-terminal domain-containing protein [Woeseiaceae bacterium]
MSAFTDSGFLIRFYGLFAASPISASTWSGFRGETETGLMKAIKAALDPKNIMNPGKVI